MHLQSRDRPPLPTAVSVTSAGNPGGRVVGFRWLLCDVTERYRAREDLERRVEECTAELQASLREQDVLLREVHHRIKNDLQVISSRLSLQAEAATNLWVRCTGGQPAELAAHLGLEVYFNYLMSEDGAHLQLDSYAGVPEEVAAAIAILSFGEAICGTMAQQCIHLVAEDIQRSDDPRAALVRSLGIQAYACQPLMAHGRLLGTLSFGTRHRGSFAPDELELLQTIANQLAIAIARKQAEAALRRNEARTQAVLNALVDAIAVLDAQGSIVAVNDTWGHFGRANGASPLVCRGAGFDYLAVCHRAADAGVAAAQEALSVLHAVLQGRRTHFRPVYPCHSPAEPRWFVLHATPLAPPHGGVVVSHRDITQQKHLDEQLRASLHEKEVLLKEVHHRVKNNLQMISSLLDVQADTSTDPQVTAIVEESQARIQAIALIHESLYQTHDVAHLDAADYLHRQRLFKASRAPSERITLRLETEVVTLKANRAIPCGLILNELLANCFKHAFPAGRVGEIRIALRQEAPRTCTLTVCDTGVGFPDALDFRQTDSLGLQLICLLTE